ncbi:DNA adenine methylase [Shouchella sp. JSM 1781072]|uniref:DNA adenine methylase n=1 Tax=Shouchella sp. JSM 1781072 TaxID=3344581 RepID=UPI0035C1D20C
MANPSPLRYPGGKYKTFNYIKKLVKENNCSTYIEPFAGGAAVALELLLNDHVKKIIINDIDRSIYALWYSILYNTNELIELIERTDVNIQEWRFQKNIQNEKTTSSLLLLGYSTLFLNRTNHSGIIKGGVMGGKEQKGNYKLDCRFNKTKLIEKISIISQKKHKIELHNLDALQFIELVIKKTRQSFTFFDPPYFAKGPSLYTDFYKENDHEVLAKKIKLSLKNRHWIVTYDKSIEIKSFYSRYPYFEYYLSYTAQNKTKGIEYMFFSEKTKISDPNNLLNLLEEQTVI